MPSGTRRSFATQLAGKGSAQHLRQTASQAAKENCLLSKSEPIEPVDYEGYLVKNKTSIHNDPQRELLMFPYDEISAEVVERELRTQHSSVPVGAEKEVTHLLAQECIKSYTSSSALVNNKWEAYSGSYLNLPPIPKKELTEQTFEADIEERDEFYGLNIAEPLTNKSSTEIAKKGWLQKGPDSANDSSGFLSKSFKKRYVLLKRQPDSTYALDICKDDKKAETKGQVFLDSAVEVLPYKGGGAKNAFEIRMQDSTFYAYAAETEADMRDWIQVIKRVISTDSISQRSTRTDEDSVSLNGGDTTTDNYKPSGDYHDITRYMAERDPSLARSRKQGRCELFDVYRDLPHHLSAKEKEAPVSVFEEIFANRFTVLLQEWRLKLQANIREDVGGERIDNPEPFFLTLALYDAQEGRKISENVYLDCNSDELYKMLPEERVSNGELFQSGSAPVLRINNERWLSKPGKLLFSVNSLNSNLYIVVLVEKVLQGAISSAVDPYLKGEEPKTGSKVHRAMKQYCQHIGHYRMPFAWAAKPLCRSNKQLDLTAGSLHLYRQESTRLSEEDIIKHLLDLSRPEKVAKMVAIPGSLQLVVDLFDSKAKVEATAQDRGILTPSLDVVKPYPLKMDRLPVLEVEQFTAGLPMTAEPFSIYRNHLYVYPRSVKCDNIKGIKARNIAVCIELRNSDEESALPLKCIYNRPRGSVFTSSATCAVVHHSTSPEFYEEVKICLPSELTERHHILMTFYHVSCEASVKVSRQGNRSSIIDSVIGYSWVPLMRQKRICDGDHVLSMASVLPPGYLSHEHPGISKITGPDVKWHDGGKGIFKMKLRLHSTIYTSDQHLHNFFTHCQKVQNSPTAPNELEAKNMLKAAINGHALFEPELRNCIKALHAANICTVINFLPTLLNQLFQLLPTTTNDEVAFESVRVVTHIVHEICELKKDHLLRSYVKYTFNSMDLCKSKVKSVHGELVKQLSSLLRPLNSDFLVVGKFLRYAWFFFELIAKSISQYLISTKRIKMSRTERFSVSNGSAFLHSLEVFIGMTISHIFMKYKGDEDTRNANHALSQFIKRCFTLLDRGYVFKLINLYMENFGPGDAKQLQEYKFEFIRIVCSHEHYVQLSLPTLRSGYARTKVPVMKNGILNEFIVVQDDSKCDYTLSTDYRKKHFLSGLLLQELKSALKEIKEVRMVAIVTLRNQLAKHALDNRYQKEGYLGRIVTLYLPLFNIILENKNRLLPRESIGHISLSNRNSVMLPDADTVSLSEPSMTKANSLPYSSRLSTVIPPSDAGAPGSSANDSVIYSVIAGNMLPLKVMRGGGDNGLAGSRSSICSNDSTSTIDAKDSVSLAGGQARGSGVAGQTQSVRYDKFETSEVKDLLLCFLFVVRNMPEDVLLQWMSNTSENDLAQLFEVFEICLKQFKYVGRKTLTSIRCSSKLERFFGFDDHLWPLVAGSADALATSYSRDSSKGSLSVPSRRGDSGKHFRQSSAGLNSELDEFLKNPENYSTVLMEGNLVAEVGTIVLDALALYTHQFKTHLMFREGDNVMMKSVFDLHMVFLRMNQSEQTLKHCFGLIRMFIGKFPQVLFKGKATFCGRLCYELLRCCNSRLYTIRMEACITIYFLMRANFEHSRKENFTRVRLQMMVSVSTLINDFEGVTGQRFKESLGVVNNYAKKDKSYARTKLPEEISNLTMRIRTVLMATEKMKKHQNDPEKLVDLQYSLAKQYVSSPELRTTWLRHMAKKHLDRQDHSEAAHCYLHIAGAVAEFLKQMGRMPSGCKVLHDLSSNVIDDESNTIDDRAVIEELQYTEDTLIETLQTAAKHLTEAERFEALGSLYRIVIPLYEKKRDLENLADCYHTLHEAYSKAVQVTKTCKRMLGSYFRVAFYGEAFEDEDGKEYIYKEPKVTQLPEICERLKTLHGEKFGHDIVKILQDSKKVNSKDLDPHIAYIQVTYVIPHFTDKELLERKTDFEKNNNVKRFVFHTPFTKSGKAHGEITDQWMKKTILTTAKSFPYVKKRILVSGRKEVDLSPIEVAIEEMTSKVTELNLEVYSSQPDIKKLQLKLQGAVSAQVNAGPMVYAEAFLASGATSKLKLSTQNVESLKNIFREFASVCNAALELNSRLVGSGQLQYHDSLMENFKIIKERLQDILSERLLTEVMNALHFEKRDSIHLAHTTSSSSA
ncbi:dedicator of cytokinesis protein 9-like isoform X3 [Watersipora subatra]|uniref:dedicator of cytokinesis protein 9-like isoform X3 n=1 Tax=Watersipora subatra TaxID=2589382 RepID=UPI00355C1E60